MSDGIRFNSKIDPWLMITLLVASVLCLVPALPLLGDPRSGYKILAALLLLLALVPLWLLLSTRYVLSDEKLDIRCGPFSWSVPIDQITAVTPTRSGAPSPALSLTRLQLSYGSERSIMISPEPREAFIRQLEARLT
jgi:Bacterial PH domain